MDSDELGSDILSLPDHHNPEEPKVPTKPFLSFAVLPGFKCFFQDPVLRDGLTLHECYERVMKDHFTLQQLRRPTESLFKLSDVSMAERSKEIYFRSTSSERFYIQSRDHPIYKYWLGRDKEDQIEQLQRQLELYRRSGEEALKKKKRELKELREQQESIRERQEEEKRRRAAVLDSLKGEAKELT
jgi:hypothetical protein